MQANEVPWREAGLSEQQYGQCLGNGMSMNVLQYLFPRVLFQSKLITRAEYKQIVSLILPGLLSR